MEIRNGKLHLSQDDIENIIAKRIKEIQDKLDESYYKIRNGQIAPNHLEITMLEENDYVRFKLGEGLQKKEEDFAAEVAAQIK